MKKLSERLTYLMADNGIKQSGGLLQALQDIEELLADGDHPDEKLDEIRELFGVEMSY